MKPTQVRVGIHTGSCVSGLIGTKLCKFSLWGDTMNTASQMESTSKPGTVQISGATMALLESSHKKNFVPSGGVEVKGRGLMQTYLWDCDELVDSQSIDSYRPTIGSMNSYHSQAIPSPNSSDKHHLYKHDTSYLPSIENSANECSGTARLSNGTGNNLNGWDGRASTSSFARMGSSGMDAAARLSSGMDAAGRLTPFAGGMRNERSTGNLARWLQAYQIRQPKQPKQPKHEATETTET
eukprot:gene23212-30428_t